MPDATLDTSRAKTVSVDIYDYDNLPLGQKWKDTDTDEYIDMTDYAIDFILKGAPNNRTITTYSIAAGSTTSTYITKIDSGETLNTEAMWENIRATKTVPGNPYTLIEKVTGPDGNPYVYIVYTINAKQY